MSRRRRLVGRPSVVERRVASGVDEVFPAGVTPAKREETFPFAIGAVVLSFIAFMVCYSRGYILLYGDAVAHLGIARRIYDSRNPGLAQLGGVWLPLPHLLMLPFIRNMQWWQTGLAGAWPSMGCYILAVIGIYRLGAADDDAAMGVGGDAVFWDQCEFALSVDYGDDGAAVSRGADLAGAADDGVCECDPCRARWQGGAAAGADRVADCGGGVYAL